MKIIISAESTIDLTPELKEKFQIKTIPYTFTLGDETHTDGEFPTEQIFEYVKTNKILPKTSALNEYQYNEYFTELLQEGDAVIHFCLSGGISCSCSNAQRAASELKNVYVVDTKSLSTGIALLAIRAAKLIEEGKDVEYVYNDAIETTKKVQASFVINRLDYLYKGGRCNALQLLGANLLKLKPQIGLKDGKMGMEKKFSGKWDEVVKKYAVEILDNNPEIELDEVFITYTTAPDEVVEAIRQILIKRGFKNINVTRAGCTISSHCGENTLGVLFIKK